ncbi:MAG: PAS domain S-box-containing protein [Oleispira sp.]|jgi:PAS domain S-box-containing protein
MQKQSLEKTIRKQALTRSLILVFVLSVVMFVVAAGLAQYQLNKRHMFYAEQFIVDFNKSLESLQQQVNNLAKNDLIINSLIDDSNRDAYLPVFFRSLELTVTENVAILFTDFSGDIITGKNTELYLQNSDKFNWQSSVLESATGYLDYSENGIMVAAPIVYSSYAEGAIVTYVQHLQAAVSHAFDNHLIILVGEKDQVLFSSDQSKVVSGSSFNNFNSEQWYLHQQSFGVNRVMSLEPFTSAYRDMFWLIIFMFMALVAVLIGSLYSTRLSSRMVSDMLGKLERSISSVSSFTGTYTNSPPIDNEPREFEVIRRKYDDVLRDLARTAISRDRFENVINSLDEVLMVIDVEGDLILSNLSLEQFLAASGYTLPRDLEKILPASFIHNSNNEASTIERLYDHVDGCMENREACQIRWTRNDYLNEHGKLLGAVVIGTNITASKKLESELLIKNMVIDEAQTSIIIADAQHEDFRVTYVNKAFETLTGYPAEEVLGRNCRFLQGNDTDPAAINAISKALSNEQPTTVTLLNYKKNGTTFYNQLTLNPVFNEKGIITHILGLQSDVTEQENTTRYNQQAKIKAEESAQLKSEFLASMSHEIRTPMNGIMGMLSLLLASNLNKEQEHHASLANSSARSLLTIINDILDFSKIEAGKLDIEPIEFDLPSQLAEIVASMAGKAQEKEVDITLDTHAIAIETVVADIGRIRQILINLIDNAIKFSDQGRIVVCAILDVRADDLLFTCSIEDSGIGIGKDRLPFIFDSFTQADASTTRRFGGTGLGLAICKQLVELMGGTISVDSTPGAGSTFSFNIILGKVSKDQRSGANKNNTNRRIKGMRQTLQTIDNEVRILLVEDNFTNQVFAEALLKKMGYSLDIVDNGEQALAALNAANSTKKYEVILMDCQMPVMDGFEATHKIRLGDAGDFYQGIPIIAMTANALRSDKDNCLKAGMSDYISKPFDPEILHKKLLIWLSEEPIEGQTETIKEVAKNISNQQTDCWNKEEFLDRLSGNEGVLLKVITVFLIDTSNLISALEDVISQQDFVQIKSIAHTLKGSCANISAIALVGVLTEIERAATEQSNSKINTLWSDFGVEKIRLFDVLQAHQEQNNT